LLYETTDLFFEHFGIRSIDELPNAVELRRVKLPEPPQENPPADPEQQLALSAAGHQTMEEPEASATHHENT
jgi:segregation and condensation protein B